MGVLLSLTDEYFKKSMRFEDGITINVDGEKHFIKYKDYNFVRDLIPIKNDLFIKEEFSFFGEPIYLCYVENTYSKYFKSFEYYCITESDLKDKENNPVERGLDVWLYGNFDIFSDDFPILEILKRISKFELDYLELDGTLKIDMYPADFDRVITSGENRILIFNDKEKAIEEAVDYEKYKIEKKSYSNMDQDDVEDYKNKYGDKWIDKDEIKDWFEEKFENRFKGYRDDDGEHHCRLYDELLERGFIRNTADYFYTDTDKPKFNPEDYKEKLIKCVMDDEEISREDAIKEIDGLSKHEYITYLKDFDLVDDDEDYFELDYNMEKFDDDEMIERIVNELMDEIDDFEKKYISEYGCLDRTFYDLTDLSREIVKRDGIYSKEPEISINIDGVDYFIYIREDD